ncbi:MAG TPA: 4-(cytidine 5'-diphospho)-2-C-methyl-D-erythritol kinase [Allosphingosinicella sp.]|jgi:4-diphosphocytidyl-2-C-methyl-D-erythritol kinase|nr:4-(cytidine 5'-diphospho)-2-C-methyl-D-erythritol kinase [Allosphingosinicella sp.]
MDETAYAKINLTLKVRGRSADGFHEIDTLFAFAEAGDRLEVAQGEGLTLRVEGPFAGDLGDPEDNLVLRAARLLGPGLGASLTLDKRLPVASGIGGGSADAAAALRLLNRWWGLGLGNSELLALAGRLGADVPACLSSRTARGTGRGDRLEPARSEHEGAPLLLVNPGVPLSTAEVFARWRGIRGDGNDLEPPALEIAPVIGEVLDRLRASPGLARARMSGSGATCFALFRQEVDRDEAGRRLALVRPGWWQLASRLR